MRGNFLSCSELHIEIAFLKAIGGWLEGSGWTAAPTEANVASAGTADSFLKATSVTRTRCAHQITASTLSAIPIDQAHKQNNALVKGEGGAVGLTENPSALRRWMVSGPEIARIIKAFEASMVTECPETEQSAKHHEDTRSLQSLFYRDVVSLVCFRFELV